ncbi:response regulator transcription factor [Rhodococcus erythropolis]|nr:response regulator transcription factor [Rhodococcus erythropolis]
MRIVIVDDEALMRAGLRLLLDGADRIVVVGEAGDGRQALEVIRQMRPDVVLMDIRMPTMTGIEALAELRKLLPEPDLLPRVLMLTAFDTDTFIIDALRAGATGFLLKASSPTVLVAAIRAAAMGQPHISPEALAKLIDAAGRERHAEDAGAPPNGSSVDAAESRDDLLDHLSPREAEIAAMIAEGLTNGQIASQLFLALPTVKTHIGRIMEKLGASNRVQVAIAVLEKYRGPGMLTDRDPRRGPL